MDDWSTTLLESTSTIVSCGLIAEELMWVELCAEMKHCCTTGTHSPDDSRAVVLVQMRMALASSQRPSL